MSDLAPTEVEIREKLVGWGLALTLDQAHPSVLIAVRSHRAGPEEPSLVILSADWLERHQVIAVLRQAVRQLGGPFAG